MKKLITLLHKADLSNHPELESLWNHYQQANAAFKEARSEENKLKKSFAKLKANKKASRLKLQTSKQNLEEAKAIKKMRKKFRKKAASLLKKWARTYLIRRGVRKTGKQLNKLEILLKGKGEIPKTAATPKKEKKKEKKKPGKTPKSKSNKKTKDVSPKPDAAKKSKDKSIQKKTAPRVEPAGQVEADNLTLIDGVGPKIEELLKQSGIQTFQQVASSDYDTLSTILKNAGSRFSLADPTTWPSQAALAADGKIPELKELQQELKGGK